MGFEVEDLRNIAIKLNQNKDRVADFIPEYQVPQLLVDAKLTLRKLNLKAKEVFQLDAQDLGKPIEVLLTKLQLPGLSGYLNRVFKCQHKFKEIPEELHPIYQIQRLPYAETDGEGVFQGVLISIYDFPEMKMRLQTLEKLNQIYENMLYSVSHDLNGPLANMQQVIYEMENGVEKDEENIMFFDLLNLSVLKMKNSLSDLVETNKKKGISNNNNRISFISPC